METAQSEAEARQKLADRGFFVFSVRMHFDLISQFSGAHRQQKIRPADFLIFNQQFSTLIKAGLPILKALDLLAERYRIAIELRLIQELPREVCARRMNVTIGTFDVLLFRAVRAFRKQFGDHDDG